MIKKIISTLLCVSMIIASSAVFAADGTNDLVNVALNKSIEYTTGAPGQESFTKENLIDGNTGNISDVLWDNEHTGVGYIIDLGKSYAISEFKVYAISGNGSGRDQIWIDYSDDNSTYTNIYERNNNISDGFSSSSMTEDILTINNFGTINARYIKFTSWTYGCWTEFEVYATLPIPKYVDTTYNQRVITTEFTENINASTVTNDSFKVYADNVLLSNEVDYTRAVSGKNVVITLLRDYYDTELKIEATTAIGTGEYNLAEPVTDTVMTPSAVVISGFEIAPSGQISVTVTNNTTTDDKSGVVFAMLLDSNNMVLDSDFDEFTAYRNDEDPTTDSVVAPQLSIDTSKAVGACKIKAFIWDSLSTMNVLEGYITENVGTSGSN